MLKKLHGMRTSELPSAGYDRKRKCHGNESYTDKQRRMDWAFHSYSLQTWSWLTWVEKRTFGCWFLGSRVSSQQRDLRIIFSKWLAVLLKSICFSPFLSSLNKSWRTPCNFDEKRQYFSGKFSVTIPLFWISIFWSKKSSALCVLSPLPRTKSQSTS